MAQPYTVTREKTGRIYSLVVRHPNGNDIQSFGDSQEREATHLAALLNDAYALGRVTQHENEGLRSIMQAAARRVDAQGY